MQKRFPILIAMTVLLVGAPAVPPAHIWADAPGAGDQTGFDSSNGNLLQVKRHSANESFDVPFKRPSVSRELRGRNSTQSQGVGVDRPPKSTFVAFKKEANGQRDHILKELNKLNASERIVCVWKKGTAKSALKTIDKVGLKVVYIGRVFPFGVCTGKLTEQGLKELKDDPSILIVGPSIKLIVDDAQGGVKEITDEVVAAYQHAGSMICVWRKGKRKEAIKLLDQMQKQGKLRVVFVGQSFPFAVCKWAPPLQKETLIQLQRSSFFDYVEPSIQLAQDRPMRGRVIEFPNGKPKTEFRNGVFLTTPEDPLMSKLWGMASIRANRAWTCANRTDVIVAVIDSGIDYNHPDLKANIWVNTGEIPNNGRDDDGNSYVDDYYGLNFTILPPTPDTLDRNGHGTHVAGIIGAVGNNKIGIAGVNWRVQIMGLKVFNDKGKAPRSEALMCAIDYAVKNNARVINLSLRWDDEVKYLRHFINLAQEKGVLIVCAAGNLDPGEDPRTINNDKVPQYPASFPNQNIIAVANITEKEQLHPTSHYGLRSVDLGAPGTDIFSTVPKSRNATGYASLTGTSMATPHVAGAAALIWGQQKYHHLDYRGIKKLILDNVRPIPALQGKCVTGGALDLSFLCKQSPPPVKHKPPVIICPPPRCYIPPPPRPHKFYRFRCGRRRR